LGNQSHSLYGTNASGSSGSSNTNIAWNEFDRETNANRNLNAEEMKQQKQLLIKGLRQIYIYVVVHQ